MRLCLAFVALISITACRNGGPEVPPLLEGNFFEPEDVKYRIHISPNKGISIGTAIGDAGLGDLSEKQSFTPASITKVITAAVALKILGPDFRFLTTVSWTDLGEGRLRHLTVRADGDPSVTRERLRQIAVELKKRGYKKIEGALNLVSADARKDLSYPAHGLDKEDYWSCYGSRVQNFNFQRNCASANIQSTGEARWADGAIAPAFRVDESQRAPGRLAFTHDLDPEDGSVRGYLVQGAPKKPSGIGLPVVDVKAWYGNNLISELKRAGLEVAQAPIARDLDLPWTDYFSLASEPLSILSRKMNKVSDNYLAEALFKATASTGYGKNINEAGAEITRAQIREWLKVTHSESLESEITLFEGAGLSRANQVTPRAFLALLRAFTKEDWFPVLWESLPIAGVDGTLRGRMGAGPAGKLVRAKTGTLKGAYQLAGYIPKLAPDGQTIIDYVPFVLLTATTPRLGGAARSLQDKLLGDLSGQINKKK